MKLTFLGTGADSAYPLPFCHCDYCEYARQHGGKNLRKRSSLLINDDLLIDLGPDVMSAAFQHEAHIDHIHYLLQTHAHADHFDPAHLTTRIPEYVVTDIPALRICASQGTLKKMSVMLQRLGYVNDLFDTAEQQRINASVTVIQPFEPFEIGNYQVLPILSNHDEAEHSLLFAIQQNGNAFFYGTDTDRLSDVSLACLAACGWKFDVVILDHTYGWDIDGGGHLNGNKFLETVQFFQKNGLMKETTRIFATHISHEGNPPHEAFAELSQSYGYEIAYDGLQLTLEN